MNKLLPLLILLMTGLKAHAVSTDCPIDQLDIQKVAVIGIAKDLASGEPLYCEYHYPDREEEKVVVEYRDFSQQLIARKKLDFASGLLRPNVIQEDFRHGELRKVSLITDAANDKILIAFRKANTTEVKEAELEVANSLVIDAGFDQAVRQSWDELIGGRNIKVDFVSPIHLRSFKLKIVETDKGLCRKQAYDKESEVCFLIRPNNRLVSMFVRPLVLVYDRASRQLLSYSGSVNITSSDGFTLKAEINYSYLEQGAVQ